MFDFIKRVQTFKVEGVATLAATVSSYLRGKRVDRFEHMIVQYKKHRIFDDSAYEIYERLDELRKLRNRIHIQNEKNELEPDDKHAFSKTRQSHAENCLEFVLRSLSTQHTRDNFLAQGHVNDFILPFAERFVIGKAPYGSKTLSLN